MIAVSVMSNPDVDLARMCTQTAALLLPSTVARIMSDIHTDNSVSRSRHLQPAPAAGTGTGPPPDPIATARFDYSAVIVADGHSLLPPPWTFPVVVMNPNTNWLLMQQLVDTLGRDAASGSAFDSNAFCSAHSADHPNRADVLRNAEDVQRVTQLALTAANERHAIIFMPGDPTNPLCDVCAVLPLLTSSGRPSVCFLFIEVKDSLKNRFEDKLIMLTDTSGAARELLLAPVVTALDRAGVDVAFSVLVQCGRTRVVVQP
jgi:hypothetical protein